MCGVRYWNSSCTGRSASARKQLRTKPQQQEWHLRVILRLIYFAKNEPASCEVHFGGKLGVFALAAMSGPSCQDLQPACAVSGGNCLVAIAKVQGCHLLRDSLHVQVIGMAPDVSTGIQVVGSSESDTEVVSPHISAASPGFCPIYDTPVFATPSPESCPLIHTQVFSSTSPDVSEVPTTSSQEAYTTIGDSRGYRLEILVSSSSAMSSCESRASSLATTISYEDDVLPVMLPLCVQWYVRGLASDAARSPSGV